MHRLRLDLQAEIKLRQDKNDKCPQIDQNISAFKAWYRTVDCEGLELLLERSDTRHILFGGHNCGG